MIATGLSKDLSHDCHNILQDSCDIVNTSIADTSVTFQHFKTLPKLLEMEKPPT